LFLFGPHRALRKGRYEACVFGSTLDGHHGTVLFEIASHGGQLSHFTQSFDLSTSTAMSSWPVKLAFALDADVSDIEIKCTVSASSCLQVSRITIDPAGQEITSPHRKTKSIDLVR
jgi:hypothetical protein